jgi:hypothetical protein
MIAIALTIRRRGVAMPKMPTAPSIHHGHPHDARARIPPGILGLGLTR